jgi:hypothetical protein
MAENSSNLLKKAVRASLDPYKLDIPVNFDHWSCVQLSSKIRVRPFMDEAAVARRAPAIPDLTAEV